MNYYFEPQNVNQWNTFKEVKSIGHIEPFLATKKMEIGDIVLLYVGQQNINYKPGVYAIGTIVNEPYILRNIPSDYCNNKLTVDVRIDKINYKEPYIDYYQMKKINKQFRRVHKLNLDNSFIKEINKLLLNK